MTQAKHTNYLYQCINVCTYVHVVYSTPPERAENVCVCLCEYTVATHSLSTLLLSSFCLTMAAMSMATSEGVRETDKQCTGAITAKLLPIILIECPVQGRYNSSTSWANDTHYWGVFINQSAQILTTFVRLLGCCDWRRHIPKLYVFLKLHLVHLSSVSEESGVYE